jgi:O-antigen ligase
MSRWSVSQVLHASEVVYVILALFALTQGPVYRLWSESSTYLGTAPRPSMPHVYFATFVAIQLPALVLLFRRLTTRNLFDRRIQMLSAFVLWMTLSVVWSSFARHSLPEVVSLVLTTSFGVYVATSYCPKQFFRIVLAAMSIGICLSLFAIQQGWDAAVNPETGYWIGIYYNRNSLAPVAAVALLAALGVILLQGRWRGPLSASLVGLAGLIVVVALFMLWKAESRTSPLALSLSFASLLLWLLLQRLAEKFAPTAASRVSVVVLSFTAVIVFLVVRTLSRGSSVTPGTATFNSRGGLWSQNWAGILEKPWFGWGWMAARRTPTFFSDKWWYGFATEWSHNGYHDILLGGGAVAGFLFLGFILSAVWHDERPINVGRFTPIYLVIVFIMTAATQEAFFVGTHFMWALLVAMLLQFSGNLVNQKDTSKGT